MTTSSPYHMFREVKCQRHHIAIHDAHAASLRSGFRVSCDHCVHPQVKGHRLSNLGFMRRKPEWSVVPGAFERSPMDSGDSGRSIKSKSQSADTRSRESFQSAVTTSSPRRRAASLYPRSVARVADAGLTD